MSGRRDSPQHRHSARAVPLSDGVGGPVIGVAHVHDDGSALVQLHAGEAERLGLVAALDRVVLQRGAVAPSLELVRVGGRCRQCGKYDQLRPRKGALLCPKCRGDEQG